MSIISIFFLLMPSIINIESIAISIVSFSSKKKSKDVSYSRQTKIVTVRTDTDSTMKNEVGT
jgi:hypothetical protein